MSRTRTRSSVRKLKRKIGIFTIASKNYLAYVRVLLKSVADLHPEYALYLCLADKVSSAFDPSAEIFKVIESDSIGIPNFDDMTLRYDIMEFNTAVKPFVFRWLLDNTDLDSIIYLDPDIRVFSRFVQLEAILASDVSVVLTPHITHPLEDGKNPSDYHMLQAGIFNLGFAAINRCTEAKRFIEWWGRRLETQADADFSRNLFTDQRWCDLAPCFLDRLHVLKRPGYNVAYWNLAERVIRQVSGQWQANSEPLVFFHFSGINASKDGVVSKHQNRFTWADVPACKPIFDAYRHALREEGWEETKGWLYAYASTKDGLPIPSIVRKLYRDSFPSSQDFVDKNPTRTVLELCNSTTGTVPNGFASPLSRLMDRIYRQRPDLQTKFDVGTQQGRAAFRRWFASTGYREYNLPPEFVPDIRVGETDPPASSVPRLSRRNLSVTPLERMQVHRTTRARLFNEAHVAEETLDLADEWNRLPVSVKRRLAPVVSHLLGATSSEKARESAKFPQSTVDTNFHPPVTGRVSALQDRAPLPSFLGDRYITVFMHMIWSSRPDLQRAFDLATAVGQTAFVGWFEASAQREYNVSSVVPTASENVDSMKGTRTAGTMTGSLRGANLIGYAHAELGMGEHVRMSAAALTSTAVQYGVVNFNVGVASRQDAKLESGHVVSGNPYASNIFHINADQMLLAYCQLGHDFFAMRYNIGYWAWELAKCPQEWLPALRMIDEVWAPSRFIQHAFAEHSDIPVVHMPLCVELPVYERLDRSYFGLPSRGFVFLYAFDGFSYLDRKNPYAAIRAFKKAFPRGNSDVRLVLKAMNGNELSPPWVSMIELIDGDPRIIVIHRTLNRSEMLALCDTSDCFVSLHRSEGFGRGPAEAMYLGKPVIVTNYSGNTDFTLEDNSCLVDACLIPVEEGQYPFHHGQQWAEADIGQAAWYMKKLYRNNFYARDVGARGRAYVHEHFNSKVIGARYELRLRALGLI